MTNQNNQEFHVIIQGEKKRVIWNGNEITNGLKSFNFNVSTNSEGIIELELPVHAVSLEGELQINIPVDTAKLLMQAGWTPPPREQDDVSTNDLHERKVR